MDKSGAIVDSNGKYLYGAAANPAVNTFPDAENGPAITYDAAGNPIAGTGSVLNAPIRIPTDAQSMSVGNDGKVVFVDAAGELKYAGQLILAKFPNSGGLEKQGNNYFVASPNSGTPLLSTATDKGMGTVKSGSLEMSNVDLSEEFTDMIVAQRGFQANTRIITTSDEILQELVNLKR